MSQTLARELATVLAAQETALGTLVGVLEDQERSLLDADAGGLLARLTQQERVATDLVGLEHMRLTITERLAADLHVAPSTLTLGRLAVLFPALPDLGRLHTTLATLVRRVSRVNERNAFLAEKSLGYVERLLDHLVTTLAPAPTYGSAGRARAGAQTAGLLDREA
jgi:flagellar biosynthesis/type III secretory pathway chaperone